MRRTTIALTFIAALFGGVLLASPAEASPGRVAHFGNCAQLNRAYHHGVGMPGAVDRVKGHTRRVENFTRNAAVFTANWRLDRDGDRIACEQR